MRTTYITIQQGASFKLSSSHCPLQLLCCAAVLHPIVQLVIHCRALQDCLYNQMYSEYHIWICWVLLYVCWGFDGAPHGIWSVLPGNLQGATQWAKHITPNATVKPFHPLMALTAWQVCPYKNIHWGLVFLSFKLGKCVCGFVCVSVSVLRVHNAGSADSGLHRLLACTTALLSSLISSVNASLWLIENELVYVSLQCLYKAVKETHTPFWCRTNIRNLLLYAKNSLLWRINQ